MVYEALRTLLGALEVVRPAFTRPGFSNLVVVFAGWAPTSGPHAVTQTLVTTGVAGRRHHESFHRFFSRGPWDPDEVGRLLFSGISRHVQLGGPIRIVLDDTLATRKGPHVFGIGSPLDEVHSTRRQKIFAFGHCWVMLAVLLPVPFSSRTFALPVLFRLYRTVKSCERAVDDGNLGRRVFFSTDATLTVPVVLETYAGRWAVEVCFRDLKQLLGFGDSSARKRAAVERSRRSPASSTPRSSSGSPRASTAPASPPRHFGHGRATSRGSASPTFSAPPSAPSPRSTFWIHVGVSTTYANPARDVSRRESRGSGAPRKGETRV